MPLMVSELYHKVGISVSRSGGIKKYSKVYVGVLQGMETTLW